MDITVKIIYISTIFLSFITATNIASANVNTPSKFNKKNSLYLKALIGINLSNVGKQQLDTTAGPINGYTQYIPNNTYYSSISYGAGGGYEFKLGYATLSLGIGIYQNSNNLATGQIWDIEPSNYTHILNYQYKVFSSRFMLETQLGRMFQLNNTIKIMPFVLFGIGPALNFANSYRETVVYPNASRSNFNSKLNISLSYQIGAGISYPFNNDHSRLSITYRYVDLGKAIFDSKNELPKFKLDIGRIRTNEIYLTYTHLFDF